MTRNSTSIYKQLESKGYRFEPAPRSNPRGSLYDPWRVIDARGKTVLRGSSRDDLEERAIRFVRDADLRVHRDAGRLTNREVGFLTICRDTADEYRARHRSKRDIITR